MSKSQLLLALALGGMILVGCNKEDTNTQPVSTPNQPTTRPSHYISTTGPSVTGGTDTAGPATAPSLILPPVIPGAGGPATVPSTRPTGTSGTGSGTGTGSGSSGTGTGGVPDLNK
jgi:hypothetical protein